MRYSVMDANFSRFDRQKRAAIAVVFMLVGSSSILALVLAMNSQSQAPQKEEQQSARIVAAEKKNPPKKKKQKKEPPPKRSAQKMKAAPVPHITTAISGASFGLPSMQTTGLETAMDRLLAEESVKNVVMTAATVDVAPAPMSEGRIEYPPRARQKHIEGYVVINILISAQGEVERVKVLESEPEGTFEEVTMEWARGLRFSPAMYKGNPVRTWARRRVPFRLSS